MLETPAQVSASWEVIKNVMVTLGTAASLAALGLMFSMRDDVRDIKHDLFGKDGDNGMRSEVTDLKARTKALEERNLELDAAADALERAQYDGPERRRELRRFRDKLHEHPRESDA